MVHWSDKYIGRAYIAREYDCAVMCEHVAFDEFDRILNLPADRAMGVEASVHQLDGLLEDFGAPAETPAEGDAVLLFSRGRRRHIGIYCLIDGEPYVLHNLEKAGVCRHLIRHLVNIGMGVEGYYQWK